MPSNSAQVDVLKVVVSGNLSSAGSLNGSKLLRTPFSRIVGYSVAMNPDLETDRTNIQALIAMWEDEEKRLRLILEDPQTSSSIEHQVTERLASVLAN